MIAALIPAKSLDEAKGRLAGLLGGQDGELLAAGRHQGPGHRHRAVAVGVRRDHRDHAPSAR